MNRSCEREDLRELQCASTKILMYSIAIGCTLTDLTRESSRQT